MFSKTITVSALSILVALAAAACSPSNVSTGRPAETTAARTNLIEGRKYVADAVLPDGTPITSELTFANGLMDSSACAKMGFQAGRYTVSQEGNVIVFRAQLTTKDGKSEVWTGRIDGDSISGDCVGPDGTKVSFKGKRAS
jgi:hypothetical protein